MACYHPLVAVPTGSIGESGKEKYKIRKLQDKEDIFELTLKNGYTIIPCGHCIGCRLDYSRRWADRMMLELETAKKAVFITLTYNSINAHWSVVEETVKGNCGIEYPVKGYTTLDKRDAQLWLKRLRKEFSDYKLRFYLAGEYGDKNKRAHLHCIIFGIDINDIGDCVVDGRSELGDQYYRSLRIWKTWKKGRVCIADVNWKTCAYVARYCTKKLNGDYAIDYAYRNCIPEFAHMSRKPGLGAQYLYDHPDALDFVNINLSTPDGGLKINIPKYYVDRLNFVGSEDNPLYDPEKYARLVAERKQFALDNNLLKMKRTDLLFKNYKEVEEMHKLAKISVLKRDKVR